MRRRDLLGSVVAAAALAPFGAAAQPGPPTIGFLSSLSPEADAFLVRERTAFLEGLEKAGFVAGRNVAIEYRFSGGENDRLPTLATELVRLPAAVLVALGAPGAVAAKKAAATIPVVFGSGVDPVQLGLVESLNRPAGNATGVSLFASHLGPKRLEMLRELLPSRA